MSIYRFSDGSPVATVAFRYADGVPTVALIEASKTATPKQISTAIGALSNRGMSLVPITIDERDLLQVSGFLTEQSVIDALVAKESVKGSPEITREAHDDTFIEPSKTKEFLENYSLRLAGGLNLIGDVAMHVGGYGKLTAKVDKMTGNPLTKPERKASIKAGAYDLAGGGLYTLGGLNSVAFGNSKSDTPLADRTANFIAHVANPQAVPLDTQKKPDHFFRRRTADVTLGAYALGAGVLLTKGATEYKAFSKKLLSAAPAEQTKLMLEKKESGWMIAYGASSLVFKLLSLFIKEKPKLDEDQPKSSNPIVRTMDWFVEKPLRIFGVGSFITDSLYAKHTYAAYKGKPASDYVPKIITTLSYFSSDILAAMSSKNLIIKPLDTDDERGIIALAAKSIADQPPEKRDELVLKTAHFLSNQPEMQGTPESIAIYIREQVKHLKKNPWTVRIAEQAEQETPLAR